MAMLYIVQDRRIRLTITALESLTILLTIAVCSVGKSFW